MLATADTAYQYSAGDWIGSVVAPSQYGNIVNSAESLATWQRNEQSAQNNRDFQERMSNTAYQRAVADMRKAGLNPYLAYSNGGASTPSGSSAGSSAFTSASGSETSQAFQSFVGGIVNAAFKLSENIGNLANTATAIGFAV